MRADDAFMEERRKTIFKAGAEAADSTWPIFKGYELGSMEACNYFDGYASTHPEFKNPYRQRQHRG